MFASSIVKDCPSITVRLSPSFLSGISAPVLSASILPSWYSLRDEGVTSRAMETHASVQGASYSFSAVIGTSLLKIWAESRLLPPEIPKKLFSLLPKENNRPPSADTFTSMNNVKLSSFCRRLSGNLAYVP